MKNEVLQPFIAWKQLRSGGHVDSGPQLPTKHCGISTSAGAVRVALGSAGEARLLIPVNSHDKLPEFPNTPALSISDATYTLDGVPVRYIDLTCQVGELEDVFSEVASDLLRRIDAGEISSEAVLGTLSDFRSLLLDTSHKEVSESEILGLIGELLVLKSLLEMSPNAFNYWRGPLGDRHDFRRNKLSLEVKVTSRTANQIVTISSIDQLEPPNGGELFLFHITLERAANAKLSVSSIFTEITELVASSDILNERMAMIGCHDPHSIIWNRISVTEEKRAIYTVTADFPRITEDSFYEGRIPAGIRSIEYTIDLSSAQNQLISDEATKHLFHRLIA